MNINKNKLLLFVAFLATVAVILNRFDYGRQASGLSNQKQTAAIVNQTSPAISDSAAGTKTTATVPKNQTSVNELVPVLRVIDGDTIVAEVNSQPIHIRLIGINSPEPNDKRARVACLAQKAKEEAEKLLNGQNIYLEKDPTQGDYDKYNRLLAYVFIGDISFNKLMIEEGYAYEYTYRLPYKYQSEFKAAQSEARAAQKGLWNINTCGN